MSGGSTNKIQLGFAEEQDGWLLTSRFFPSKIGGTPAWLDLQNLPEAKELLCDYCNEPCIFLCQIYAGSEHIAHAFHRTIFVLICKNGKCCSLNQSGNIKVFRSQLRLKNIFYPDVPADESVEIEAVTPYINICRVCGCRGPLICGKCKKACYCGQSHQKLDWKDHKNNCGVSIELKPNSTEILFPEFEVIIEQEEPEELNAKKESEKEAEKRRLREYEEMVRAGDSGTMTEISEVDFNEFSETKEDKSFGKFKKTIDSYETQVLRYDRHGSPLWISDHGKLDPSKVPKCVNCSSKRTFEFQIMPQMLNELKNYDLDWGVIAIYTCEKDCDVDGKYIPEFCYKQDITKTEEDGKEIDIDKLKLNSLSSQDRPETSETSSIKEIKSTKSVTKKKKKSELTAPASEKKAFEENDEW